MSNLNIFMKNNKGYYSWIHSLNKAAIDSHIKGKKMLAESKEQGPDEAAKAKFLKSKMERGERRDYNKGTAPTDVNPNRFDGPDGGTEANANEVAQGVAEIAPQDVSYLSDPDAFTVPSASHIPDQVPAAREHPEPWYRTREEAEEAARAMGAFYKGETAPEEEDFVPPHEEKPAAAGGSWTKPNVFGESANKKINKIIAEMRGGDDEDDEDDEDFDARPIGGMMRPGTATEPASLSMFDPELENVLFRNLKGPRNATTRMQHLIKIISNPKKFPPHHFRIAHEKLNELGFRLNQANADAVRLPRS